VTAFLTIESARPITHTGSYTVNSGLGSLGVYGWSTNPLVEYYIMEVNNGITVSNMTLAPASSMADITTGRRYQHGHRHQ
jgi:hypothetical protein